MKSLLPIFVIAVCIAAYFMYIKPMAVEIKVLSAKKTEYNNVLDQVKEIKEKRDAVFMEYDSISDEEKDRLNKIIPETFNSVLLLNNLSVLTAKYAVTIKDFKIIEQNSGGVGTIDTNSAYKTTNITMKFNGQYDQFIGLLNEIETSLSLIDIIGLDITSVTTSTGKTGQSTAMDYTLEAKTYSLR